MNTCNCCENKTENKPNCLYAGTKCEGKELLEEILCDDCLCNCEFRDNYFIQFNDEEYICWGCFGTMKEEFEKNINIDQNDKDKKM